MAGGREETVSDEEILQFFINSDDPFLTTTEVADRLGFSNQGTKDRLNPLVNTGYLNSKRAGRTLCWWITKDGEAYLQKEDT